MHVFPTLKQVTLILRLAQFFFVEIIFVRKPTIDTSGVHR